jgi:hypothetical protein
MKAGGFHLKGPAVATPGGRRSVLRLEQA